MNKTIPLSCTSPLIHASVEILSSSLSQEQNKRLHAQSAGASSNNYILHLVLHTAELDLMNCNMFMRARVYELLRMYMHVCIFSNVFICVLWSQLCHTGTRVRKRHEKLIYHHLKQLPHNLVAFPPWASWWDLKNCFPCFQMNCMIYSTGSVVYKRRRTFQLLPDEAWTETVLSGVRRMRNETLKITEIVTFQKAIFLNCWTSY